MNGMPIYIIRGTFARIMCAFCRGNGFLVRPQSLDRCPSCNGEGMHE